MAATPELRFLALCLPGIPGDNRDQLKNFPTLDWSVLLAAARWQGMMPLLAFHLLPSKTKPLSTVKVPESVLAQLRNYQERHLFRSLTQTAALVELQSEFKRNQMKILPWKGPSVGVLLYGSATLRESADLDFLFFEKDLQSLLQITQKLGYQLLGSSHSESKDLYILKLQREFTFGRSRDQSALEFHLQILPSRFALWQDSENDIHRAATTCTFASVDLLMQNPEDLLVSLCAHATKHHWDRMKWSCDIAQFLKVYSNTLDWPSLFIRQRKAKKDFVVILGLALAAKLYELHLPAEILAAFQNNPGIVALANDLADHLMSGSTEPIPADQRKAVIALLCPRLRDRIAYSWRPIVELNYEDLYISVDNRIFFFINYGFRVIRLLKKYGPHRVAAKTAGSVRSGL